MKPETSWDAYNLKFALQKDKLNRRKCTKTYNKEILAPFCICTRLKEETSLKRFFKKEH